MAKIIVEERNRLPVWIEEMAKRMADDKSGRVARIEDVPVFAELHEGHAGHLVIRMPLERTSFDFHCSCGATLAVCWSPDGGEIDFGTLAVGEWAAPQIDKATTNGKMPKLLPAGK